LIASLTIIGLYYFPNTLIGPIGGRLVAGLIVAMWTLFQIFKEFGLRFNFHLLKSTFGYNHYTFIYQLQLWVVNYLDRFIMVFFLPLSVIGIYDFALKCMVAIEFIMSGLHGSFYPKVVSTVMAQDKKGSTVELNRYYHGLTAVIMFVISAGILVLPFLVSLLKEDRGYNEAVQYLPYVAIIYILRSLRFYFAAPYGILKYTKPLAIIYFIISIFKILLMVLLVKNYGVYGIIISTFLASGFEIILLKFGIQSKFKFEFNFFKLVLTPLL
jgi:O-antigen/teichoic acid export membrane protein